MTVQRERRYKGGSHVGGLYTSGGHVDDATSSLDVTEYIARGRSSVHSHRASTPDPAVKHINGR